MTIEERVAKVESVLFDVEQKRGLCSDHKVLETKYWEFHDNEWVPFINNRKKGCVYMSAKAEEAENKKFSIAKVGLIVKEAAFFISLIVLILKLFKVI